MEKIFRNDFLKWHFSFLTLYLLTFIAGWFRTSHSFFYTIHPLLGISTVLVPFIVFVFSKNKRLIQQMIKNNFNLKGKPLVKVAKISTQIILVYYLFSIVSGLIINYIWSISRTIYDILQFIHGLAIYIVPLAVVTHVTSRLLIKRQKNKK